MTKTTVKSSAVKMQDWCVDNLCSILRTKLEHMLLAAKKTIYARQSPPEDLSVMLGEFIGVWGALVSLRHPPAELRAPAADMSVADFAALCQTILSGLLSSDSILSDSMGSSIADPSASDSLCGLPAHSVNELRAMGVETAYDVITTPAEKFFSGEHLSETSLNNLIHWVADISMAVPVEKKAAEEKAALLTLANVQATMRRPIEAYTLSVRTRNVLQRMGVVTWGDLVYCTEEDLRGNKNLGETSLKEIKQELACRGLSLGQIDTRKQQLCAQDIVELNLSVRARKRAVKLGVTTIGDLIRLTAEDLLGKQFGAASLNEVREKLAERGLKLRDDQPNQKKSAAFCR